MKILNNMMEDERVVTENLFFSKNALKELPKLVKEYAQDGLVLVVYFEDVRFAFEKVKAMVNKAESLSFPGHTAPSIEGVKAIKDKVKNTRLLISVGSGSVTDMVRLSAYELNLPFIVIATAPSMDGYLSSNSPIYVNGFKETKRAKAPDAVIVDTDIILTAPNRLLASGIGDILGKYTANFDWYFAHVIKGEPFDEGIFQSVIHAADECYSALRKINNKREEAIIKITECLLISSLGMQMLDNSRCASGGEHHIAHTMEMMLIHRGLPSPMHGECVFLASIRLLPLYRDLLDKTGVRMETIPDKTSRQVMLKEYLGVDQIETDNYEDVEQTLKKLKLFNKEKKALNKLFSELTTNALNWEKAIMELYDDDGNWVEAIPKDVLPLSVSLASDIRTKYTMLTFMRDLGLL